MLNTSENPYYKKYREALDTVLGCFYIPSQENIIFGKKTYVKRRAPLSCSELINMVKIIGIDETALKLIIYDLIKWGLVYDCSPIDSKEKSFRLVE